MAIIKYTRDMSLTEGMYVNLDSIMREGFAGRPVLIKKVTAASIVCNPVRIDKHFKTGAVTTEVESDTTRRKNSITWVCDTLEEAQHMFEASQKHVQETFDALKTMQERAIAQALGQEPSAKSGPHI